MIKNKRITEICEFIDKTKLLIDVGSDHAYLAISCIKQKIAKSAVVTDINTGPINRAKDNITRYGLLEHIKTVVCDGLDDITLQTGNTIVIAGMGGELTANIIKRAIKRLDDTMSLILQPASSVHELKKFLFENNFEISKEKYFLYRKKPYIIIKTEIRNTRPADMTFDLKDIFLPGGEIQGSGEALTAYFKSMIKRQKAVLSGYIHTKDAREEEQKKLVKELGEFYESI